MRKKSTAKRPVSRTSKFPGKKKVVKISPAVLFGISDQSVSEPPVSVVALGSSVIPPVPPPAPSGPKEEPKPSSVVDRGLPLPDSYGVDRVVALPRDPRWVFCYWELSGGVLHEVISERGSAFVDSSSWVLRIHRVDEGIAVDIEVDPSIGGWYVNVGRPGRYQFEISLVSPYGEFVSLAASRVIVTPSESMSAEVDERWESGFGFGEMERMLAQMLGLKDGRLWSAPSSGGLVKGPGPGLPSSLQFLGASGGGQLSGRPIPGSMEFLGASFAWVSSFMGASGMPSSLPGSLQMQVRTPRQGVLNADPNLDLVSKKGDPSSNTQPDLPGMTPGNGRKFPRVLRGIPLPKCTWPKASRATPGSPDRIRRLSKAGV